MLGKVISNRVNYFYPLMQLMAILAFPASLFIIGASDDLDGVGALIDTPSAIFTFFTPIIISILFKLGGRIPIGETLLATGVPLGLIGSYVGVIQISASLNEGSGEGLTFAVAVMLICALYGGLTSSIGYAMTAYSRKAEVKIIKKRYLISAIFIMIFIILMSISRYSGFFDPVLVLLYAIFISSFLVLNKGNQHFTSTISDASIFTSIIIIIASLIFWFGNGTDDISKVVGPVLTASRGVMYGSFIYLVAYIVSLGCNRKSDINVKKMNWHLIEVNSFLVFLALAPVSLTEFTEQRLEEEKRQAELEETASLIEGLQRRIENLERNQ